MLYRFIRVSGLSDSEVVRQGKAGEAGAHWARCIPIDCPVSGLQNIRQVLPVPPSNMLLIKMKYLFDHPLNMLVGHFVI